VLLGATALSQIDNSQPKTTSQSATGDVSGPGLLDDARQAAGIFRERGFSGQLSLVNDWSKNFFSARTAPGFINRYSLDLAVGLVGDKTLPWKGASAFVRLKHHRGDQGCEYVGDSQGFSNIDDVPRTHLYELWFQQRAFDDALRIKAGKIDANSEFAVAQNAGDFLNSSMGYSPTILALPTYPEPQPGLSAFVRVHPHYLISAGVFRTARAGPMLLLEGAREWSAGDRELDGRMSLGFWRVDGPLERFDGDRDAGAQGFYSVLEQSVWKRGGSSEQKLSGFLQFGHANGEVSSFTHHLGAGVVLNSPFAIRPHDSAGFGGTWVKFSDDRAAGFQRSAETAFEFYYKFSIYRFFSVVPDMQYIRNPGGLIQQSDALVLTPRVNLSF
jgi:carbohydrate-selective porin OprB